MSADFASSCGEVVEGVRVVPEDPEVRRRGRHRGQPAGDLLGDHRPGRVGVGRHDPDALDRRVVLDQRLDGGDVRAVVEHRHGHHLDAVRRQHREVPVVAGHRADEGDLLLVLPRPRRVDPAVQQVLHEHVVHHRQARAAAGHQLVGVDPEQLGEQLAQLAQPAQAAVVAHVDPVAVLDAVRQREQPVGQVELGDAGLAPGQVELQPPLLQPGVGRPLLLEVGRQRLGGALGEGGAVGGGGGLGAHAHIVAEASGAGSGEFAPGPGRPVCLPFGVITHPSACPVGDGRASGAPTRPGVP